VTATSSGAMAASIGSWVGAIDQGTTSTRFFLYDHKLNVVGAHQREFTQIHPQAGYAISVPLHTECVGSFVGPALCIRERSNQKSSLTEAMVNPLRALCRWVEHDPMEILSTVRECMTRAVEAAEAKEQQQQQQQEGGATTAAAGNGEECGGARGSVAGRVKAVGADESEGDHRGCGGAAQGSPSTMPSCGWTRGQAPFAGQHRKKKKKKKKTFWSTPLHDSSARLDEKLLQRPLLMLQPLLTSSIHQHSSPSRCPSRAPRSVPGAWRPSWPGGKEHFQATTGLPISSYFSALKLLWLLENVPEVREARSRGGRPVWDH